MHFSIKLEFFTKTLKIHTESNVCLGLRGSPPEGATCSCHHSSFLAQVKANEPQDAVENDENGHNSNFEIILHPDTSIDDQNTNEDRVAVENDENGQNSNFAIVQTMKEAMSFGWFCNETEDEVQIFRVDPKSSLIETRADQG